jgi:hypothetical protein
MIESFEEQIAKKSDIELMEIIENSTKWQKEFVDLAELEASKRNIDLDSILRERIIKNELYEKELKIGKNAEYKFFQYFLVITEFNFAYSTIVHNGVKYYEYNLETRNRAKRNLLIQILFFIVFFYFKSFR